MKTKHNSRNNISTIENNYGLFLLKFFINQNYLIIYLFFILFLSLLLKKDIGPVTVFILSALRALGSVFILRGFTTLFDESGHIFFLTIRKLPYTVVFTVSKLFFIRRILRASVVVKKLESEDAIFYLDAVIFVSVFHGLSLLLLDDSFFRYAVILSYLIYLFMNIRNKDSDLRCFLTLLRKRKSAP